MINADGFRWKQMIGPRDRRPPYNGYWYPHSSNGWGIFDFLDLCEAAGFLPIVDLNMDETPQVRTLSLSVPDWPGHRAGQHVDIRLTADDGYVK